MLALHRARDIDVEINVLQTGSNCADDSWKEAASSCEEDVRHSVILKCENSMRATARKNCGFMLNVPLRYN
jgi:hypothetical protein